MRESWGKVGMAEAREGDSSVKIDINIILTYEFQKK